MAADADKAHEGRVRAAKAALARARRLHEAAALVKAHADAEVADARQVLWSLGVVADEVDEVTLDAQAT